MLYLRIASLQRLYILAVGVQTSADVNVGQVEYLEIVCGFGNGVNARFVIVLYLVSVMLDNGNGIDVALGVPCVLLQDHKAGYRNSNSRIDRYSRLVDDDVSECDFAS